MSRQTGYTIVDVDEEVSIHYGRSLFLATLTLTLREVTWERLKGSSSRVSAHTPAHPLPTSRASVDATLDA